MTVSRSLPSLLRGAMLVERMLRVADSGPRMVVMLDFSRVMLYVCWMRSANMKPYMPNVDDA